MSPITGIFATYRSFMCRQIVVPSVVLRISTRSQTWFTSLQALAAQFGGTTVEEGTVQEAVAGGHRFGHIHPLPSRLAHFSGWPRGAARPAYVPRHR